MANVFGCPSLQGSCEFLIRNQVILIRLCLGRIYRTV